MERERQRGGEGGGEEGKGRGEGQGATEMKGQEGEEGEGFTACLRSWASAASAFIFSTLASSAACSFSYAASSLVRRLTLPVLILS